MRITRQRERPGTAVAQRVQRLLVLWLVAASVLVVAPTAVLAHPALTGTTSAAGYAVTSPPGAATVASGEPVTPVGETSALRLRDGPPITVDVSFPERGPASREKRSVQSSWSAPSASCPVRLATRPRHDLHLRWNVYGREHEP